MIRVYIACDKKRYGMRYNSLLTARRFSTRDLKSTFDNPNLVIIRPTILKKVRV